MNTTTSALSAAIEFLQNDDAHNLLGLNKIRVNGDMLTRGELADVLMVALIQQKAADATPANEDTLRLEFIANAERTVVTNKWMVQVLSGKDQAYYAYHTQPDAGIPDVLHPDRITALRAAVDKARSNQPNAKEK